MIRKFNNSDLDSVMEIWLNTNAKTHSFISQDYWAENYESVKKILPLAEVFVYENEVSKQIEGFIGTTNNYISGIFVSEYFQSKGIGKQLLDYVKQFKSYLVLSVYQKNKRAIHFYQREDFIIQSQSMDENTNENELIMIWEKKI